jgi:hypothetical protein
VLLGRRQVMAAVVLHRQPEFRAGQIDADHGQGARTDARLRPEPIALRNSQCHSLGHSLGH